MSADQINLLHQRISDALINPDMKTFFNEFVKCLEDKKEVMASSIDKIQQYSGIIKKYRYMHKKMKQISVSEDKIRALHTKFADTFAKKGKAFFFNKLISYSDEDIELITSTIDGIHALLLKFSEYLIQTVIKELKKIVNDMKLTSSDFLENISELTRFMEAYILCYKQFYNFIDTAYSFQNDAVWSNRSPHNLERLLDNKYQNGFQLHPQIRTYFLQHLNKFNAHTIILFDKYNTIRKLDFGVLNESRLSKLFNDENGFIHGLLRFTLYYYVYNMYVVKLSNTINEMQQNEQNGYILQMSNVFVKLVSAITKELDKKFPIIRNLAILKYNSIKTSALQNTSVASDNMISSAKSRSSQSVSAERSRSRSRSNSKSS